MSSSPTETLVDVTMPQMGVSVAEGTVVEWRKQPGDWIEADEIIASISTDKIDTDVESPATGRLQEILVDVGTTVEVGTVMARIATDAKPGEAHASESDSASAKGTSEADVAVQLQKPARADAKVARLGRMHLYPFASKRYIELYGLPKSADDIRQHRLIDQKAPQVEENVIPRLLNLPSIEGIVAFRGRRVGGGELGPADAAAVQRGGLPSSPPREVRLRLAERAVSGASFE